MHFSKILAPFARRFVAGETSEQGVDAARQINARGMGAILDYLGEDVTTAEEADAGTQEYLRLLTLINQKGVKASISLKASQMGISISPDLCVQNISRVLEAAQRLALFVWIDMEGSALTQKTIDLFVKLRERSTNVGLCLQAYLVRTGADVDDLTRRSTTIRLCKGAYKEPPTIALADKAAVDGQYRMLVQKLLKKTAQGVFPAFATHDPKLIQTIVTQAKENNIPPSAFEFQMLYGIQNDRLERLSKDGYQTQVYIPFGSAWLPYFLRRLRERKENIYFLAKNVLKK